jgi:hypothetical protein
MNFSKKKRIYFIEIFLSGLTIRYSISFLSSRHAFPQLAIYNRVCYVKIGMCSKRIRCQ